MKDAALFLACFVIAVVITIPVVSGTLDGRIADAKYIEYGQGFAAYTKQLSAINAKGQKQVATATLIGDHWALTAAHVIEGCTGITVGGHGVSEAIIHPQWRDVLGENDIAILRLCKPFDLDYYPPLATKQPVPGSTLSLAGYGATGPMSTGFVSADGKLRAGTNKIERYERHMMVCALEQGSSAMEFGIAPGDSGGPAFCGGELVGVHSVTMADKGPLSSRQGEESGHTSVIEFVPWIVETMEANGGLEVTEKR